MTICARIGLYTLPWTKFRRCLKRVEWNGRSTEVWRTDATGRNRRGDATSSTTTGDNPTALHRSARQPQALARSRQDSDSTSNKQFVVPSCARCPSTCRQSLFLPNDSIPVWCKTWNAEWNGTMERSIERNTEWNDEWLDPIILLFSLLNYGSIIDKQSNGTRMTN